MAIRLALVALFTISKRAIAHEHAVYPLNSDNFEHATQAATGQTTGFWLVYFGKEDAAADQRMWRAFAEQQREEHPWLVHAFVDVDSNPSLAERFAITTTPAFLLFRDRKMYRFKAEHSGKIDPSVVDALTAFASRGWRSVPSEKVPRDQTVTRGYSHRTQLFIVGGAIAALVLAAVVGQYVQQYIQAATPSEAQRSKGQ